MEKYKTIGHRFAALIIDGLIMIPLGFLTILIPNMEDFPKLSAMWTIIISFIPVVYTIL